MGKEQRSPQNGKVPSDAAVRDDAATRDVATASSRQRPEDILAHTLTSTAHPEGTDGWSARGRRIFLIAMAVSGVLLVVAGLLVTKELAPTGRTGPLETPPSNGSPTQLLQTHDDQTPQTPPASAPLAIPIPGSPASRPSVSSSSNTPSSTPTATAVPQAPPRVSVDNPTPTTAVPKAPTTTVPCGILGQTLQSAQLPIPCGAGTGLPLGGRG
jgi:predicted small lipoprotein YifL